MASSTMQSHLRCHRAPFPIQLARMLLLICFAGNGWSAAQRGNTPAMIDLPPRQSEGLLPSEESLRQFYATQPFPTIEPRKPLNEQEQARTESLAWYGKGRLHFQRGELDLALQAYQRAWQWNPKSMLLLRDIIPIAFQLGYRDQTVRYAIIATERESDNAEQLAQLSMILAAEADYERAAAMLKAAIGLSANKRDLQLVRLYENALRLALLIDDIGFAVEASDVILAAIESPADFGTTEGILREQLGQSTGEGRSSLAALYALMGNAYLSKKQYENCEKVFDRLFAETSDGSLRAYHRAVVAADRSRWPEAEEALQVYLLSGSEKAGAAAYELLVSILSARHAAEATESEINARLQSLYEAQPANETLARFLASRRAEAKQYDDAISLLEPWLEARPDLELSELLLEAYVAQNRPGPIIVRVGQFADITGGIDLLQTSLEPLVSDLKRFEGVLEEARKRLKDRRRPMLGNESFAVARMCLWADSFDAADTFAEHAMEDSADANRAFKRRLRWGIACLEANQAERAITQFTYAREHSNEEFDQAMIVGLLANAHEMNGELDRALEIVTAGMREFPDDVALPLQLASMLARSDRNQQVITTLEQMIARFENDHSDGAIRDAVKAARNSLSVALIQSGRIAEASAELERILDEYPEDKGTMNDLGYLWSEQGIHLERSLRMIRKAVDSDPENAAYLDSLGWVYHQMGRHDEALVPVQKALELMEQPDGVIIEHLGDIFASLGKLDQARQSWQAALESFQRAEKANDVARMREKIASGVATNNEAESE